jgi:hypothetical protein
MDALKAAIDGVMLEKTTALKTAFLSNCFSFQRNSAGVERQSRH